MVELIEIYLFHGICRSYLSTSIPLMSLCALLVQPFWFARGLQVQWTVTSDSAPQLCHQVLQEDIQESGYVLPAS